MRLGPARGWRRGLGGLPQRGPGRTRCSEGRALWESMRLGPSCSLGCVSMMTCCLASASRPYAGLLDSGALAWEAQLACPSVPLPPGKR